MLKKWSGLVALLGLLASCDPVEELPAEAVVVEINREYPSLASALEEELSYLLDTSPEFNFDPQERDCSGFVIEPDTTTDYKLKIVEPDNNTEYTLKIISPGDDWCVTSRDLGLRADPDVESPSVPL
jgi:hypothetical protein